MESVCFLLLFQPLAETSCCAGTGKSFEGFGQIAIAAEHVGIVLQDGGRAWIEVFLDVRAEGIDGGRHVRLRDGRHVGKFLEERFGRCLLLLWRDMIQLLG